jgi:hypothetical protein
LTWCAYSGAARHKPRAKTANVDRRIEISRTELCGGSDYEMRVTNA